MSKRDITVRASKNGNIPQQTIQKSFDLILEAIKETLEEGKTITIANFGTFSVIEKKEKNFKNPSTGVASILPKRKAVKFKANKNIIKKS